MQMKILEALRIYQGGKLDLVRALLLGVPVLLFIGWRLSSGVYGSERILQEIESGIVGDYREGLYAQHGLLGDGSGGSDGAEGFPYEELENLDVVFKNVSMAAPLLSWSAKESVGVRFDYELIQNGTVKDSRRKVYKLAGRSPSIYIRDCSPLTYYLQYL